MKRHLIRFALLFIIAIYLGGCSKEANSSEVEAGVRSVLNAQMDGWNKGDLNAYMSGYWNSPDLIFYANGTQTRGWQPTLDRYKNRYQGEGKHMGTLSFPELDIVVLSQDAAMARGRWHLKMPDGKELDGMTSVVFQRFPEGFRIIHDHSSAGCP